MSSDVRGTERKAHPFPPCRRRINAHMDGHYAPDQPPFLKPATGRVALTSNPDIILQILVYHFHKATKNQADAKMHAEAFALSDSPFKTLPKLNPACFQTEYLRMFFFLRRLVILEKLRMWLSWVHSQRRWPSGFRKKKEEVIRRLRCTSFNLFPSAGLRCLCFPFLFSLSFDRGGASERTDQWGGG